MKSIMDVLPVELIQAILLRVPARHLIRLKLVSKLWHSLISNPDFVELHLHRSSELIPPAFFFAKSSEEARLVDLHALINEDATIDAAIKDVPIPFVKTKKHRFFIQVLGSCRGFVFLHYEPHFILWNPVTGYRKQIPHHCDFSRCDCHLLGAILYGIGYDASNDDYLIIFASNGDYIDCFSVRINSWIKIDVAFPIPLRRGMITSPEGLFLNGAIHWLIHQNYNFEAILTFDVKQRSFSMIPLPEKKSVYFSSCNLVILRGCLVLYFLSSLNNRTQIWMMEDYKAHSSWTLYEIRRRYPCVEPLLGLSNGSDFIILDKTFRRISKYSLEGELLQHFRYYHDEICHSSYLRHTVYTESLATLPYCDRDKKKWAKIWSRCRGFCRRIFSRMRSNNQREL